ncbi:MAG: polyphosphate polymerase domain-containing protein [bacterium]
MLGSQAEDVEHELKLVLGTAHVPDVLRYLRRVARPDPVFPVGAVSSIYFDTRDLLSFGEKQNSDYLKTKFRLRWYRDAVSGANLGPAFVEVKSRIGTAREKRRLPTSWSGEALAAMELDDPRLAALAALFRAAGVSVPPGLVPLISIAYRRHRFVDPTTGVRVALDTEIRVEKVNSRVVPTCPTVRPSVAVVEAKGTAGELPPSFRRLVDLGCRRASFSKFGICLALAPHLTT